MACLFAEQANSQIRSGSAFLKVLPGARHQGMAAGLTGAIDEIHAFYANPGATGFLRQWQWSAAYTEWIADSYNLSLNYGGKLRTPWSKQARYAFGIHYQGIRKFDSTNGAQPSASASDLLFTASFGNPLSFFSRNLSIGINAKYFRSELHSLTNNSLIFDAGLLYRSNRFVIRKGPFEYGILSAGIAVTQLGKSLQFISEETPLPRSVRAGAALNIGSHKGLQVQFTADYQNVRDEGGSLSIGAEAFLFNLLGIRGGYNFGGNRLSNFSFGMSLRLDDRFLLTRNTKKRLIGRDNGLRVDLAGLEKSEFFSTTYRAGVTHYPVGPEKFAFHDPNMRADGEPDKVELAWEASRDPDLYDEINYILLIERTSSSDKKSQQLKQFLYDIKNRPQNLLELIEQYRPNLYLVEKSNFFIDEDSEEISFSLDQLAAGDYWWSVLAYDKDQHLGFAEKNGERISHFRILPDLQITRLSFDHSNLITEDDYQGDLNITVSNQGLTNARKFSLVVYDSLTAQLNSGLNGGIHTDKGRHSLHAFTIADLPAGADTTFTVSWNTQLPGRHIITAIFDLEDLIHEADETNNAMTKAFYTIPKGSFKTEPEVVAQIDTVYEYELPFIAKVYFDHNSAKIKKGESSLFYSPLDTLAKRLEKHQDTILFLQGSADATNGEAEDLPVMRAKAVRDYLLALGVNKRQIRIPKNSQIVYNQRNPELDARWVLQERRYVRIFARHRATHKEVFDLFHSVPVILPKSSTLLTVPFSSKIEYSVPAVSGTLYLSSPTSMRTDKIDIADTINRADTLFWQHFNNEHSDWINQQVHYRISMKDSIGRTFSTTKTNVQLLLRAENQLPEKIILGMAEFRADNPSLNPDWSKILAKVKDQLDPERIQKMHFIGHACAIGESLYNDSLAKKRAMNFYQEFSELHQGWLKLLEKKFNEIEVRGEGEHTPFSIEIGKANFLEVLRKRNLEEYRYVQGQIEAGIKEIDLSPFVLKVYTDKVKLVSNNDSPIGRQINRRIEILMEPVQPIEFTSKEQQ